VRVRLCVERGYDVPCVRIAKYISKYNIFSLDNLALYVLPGVNKEEYGSGYMSLLICDWPLGPN